MTTNPTRVLVVEDSLTIRSHLCEIVASDPELELVGEAGDGKQAIELCGALRPSALTLDMCMPVMSGLSATEYIMAHFPTPILIVSASVNRSDLFKTYDALAAGAVDVLEKPAADAIDGVWQRQFCVAIKRVSRIRVITHPRARLSGLSPDPSPRPPPPQERWSAPEGCRVVALGASTGGPAALVEVLRALPVPLSVPVLVVIHIGEIFAAGFAEWLGMQTGHTVELACGGEQLSELAGRVVMARPGHHLRVRGGKLELTREPERHSCRPSIDVLFESLATECGAGVAAGLLTGMGRDGAAGLLAIRQRGGRTLAQDAATSVVYGMPREAMLLGAAQRVLPLTEIGPALTRGVARSAETQR